jgi:hypothetical protein
MTRRPDLPVKKGKMMRVLTEEQKRRAIEVMRQYLNAPHDEEGRTQTETGSRLDQDRIKVIKDILGPLVSGYLDKTISLPEFKSKIDSTSKRHALWGFKGIKGQMFFNLVVKTADNLDECDQELKTAIVAPANEQIASSRIKTFLSYVKRLGENWVEAGNTRHGCPKTGSIPFFLSFFWQIQNRQWWPVYYTNSVQVMSDLNIWEPVGDLAEDYLAFKWINEELASLFTQESGKPFDLYGVEHVFWYRGGNPYGLAKPDGEPEPIKKDPITDPAPLSKFNWSIFPRATFLLWWQSSREWHATIRI